MFPNLLQINEVRNPVMLYDAVPLPPILLLWLFSDTWHKIVRTLKYRP